MNIVDLKFIENTSKIITRGFNDINQSVRPKWADTNEPAHTIKLSPLINSYDLSEGFPIMSIRKINWKAAIDELLWIWVKKSNNINDLNSHIWDSWADESGSIGRAYGYQLAKKYKFPECEEPMDQVDNVLYNLKNNPYSRRIMTNIYNYDDLQYMNLYPCAYSVTFDVTDGRLNAILNQRSQDMLVANNWNVIQYAALIYMMAEVNGYKPGVLTHVIANAHIYDRHVGIIDAMTIDNWGNHATDPLPILHIKHHDNFYDYTIDDFELEGFKPSDYNPKIPVAV